MTPTGASTDRGPSPSVGDVPTPRRRTTIPLGNWHGVHVGADWSTLVTLALFTYLLAASVLPTARPHQPAVAYWLAGGLTALVFLLTLLGHELAHAVAARHYGLTVRSITLWMLGGLTAIDGEPATPRADAVIALSGPATSLAAGAVAGAISYSLPAGLAADSLAWLGGVNILLGVFNLLPGAPLDGGRLLRAILWGRTHDRARAAMTAARTGRYLGIGLMVLGFLDIMAGSLVGLWLVLLGWFLMTAAAGEQAASLFTSLRGIPARDVMTPVVIAPPDWWTVDHFLAEVTAAAAAQEVYPLLDFTGRPSALLTLEQLETVPPPRRSDVRLRDVGFGRRIPPLVVPPDADLAEVAAQLPAHGGVAVVADDHPIGLVTARELTRAARLARLR